MAMWSPCTILSCPCMSCTILIFCCNMDLVLSLLWYLSPAATITTTSGIGGVQIQITLVSSTTGLFMLKCSSIWTVQIVDLDFRSEFLCQSSNLSQNLQIPLNHLVCLGYLPCPCNPVSPICPQTQCSYRVPQKLHKQRAKHQSHSHSTQVKQNVQPEHNTIPLAAENPYLLQG